MSVVSLFTKKDADARLMLAYAKGDTQAFEKLYRSYKNQLYRFFLRQCGQQSTAEELYQELWIRVIKASTSYKAEAKFNTWLYRIAHNLIIDYYRKPSPELEELNEDTVPSVHSDNPESIISSQEKLNRFLVMIRTLPEDQREVFILKEETGLTLNEIAECTNSSFETVKSRLRYAVSKLKQGLQETE